MAEDASKEELVLLLKKSNNKKVFLEGKYKDLIKKYKSATALISNFKKKQIELEKEKDQLRITLQDGPQANGDSPSNLPNSVDTEEIQDDLRKAQERISELEKQRVDVQIRVEDQKGLQETRESPDSVGSAPSDEIKSIRAENLKLSEQMRLTQENADQSQEDMKASLVKIAELQSNLETMSTECSQLKSHVKKAEKSLNTKDKRIAKLEGKSEKLRKDAISQRKELSENLEVLVTKKVSAQKMSDHLSIELEQAKATIERQEENVAKLKEESASLKEALSRCEAELSDRAKSISSLEGKLKVETERANDLDAKLKISEETHQKMASEYSSSSTRAKGESEKDLEEHRSLVATLETALEEREQSMIEVRADLSETRAELNEARNGAACFEEIKSGLEQQIGKLRSDIERQQAEWESTENRLRDVILSKDAQMSSIKRALSIQEKKSIELSKLEADLSSRCKQYQQSHEDLALLKPDYQKAVADLSKCRSQFTELKRAHAEQTAKVENVDALLAAKQAALDRSTEKSTSLLMELDRMTTRSESMMAEQDGVFSSRTRKLRDEMKKGQLQAKKELLESQKKIQVLRQTSDTLQKRMSSPEMRSISTIQDARRRDSVSFDHKKHQYESLLHGAQVHHEDLWAEIKKLRGSRLRGDADLDYLKNILVNFLRFQPPAEGQMQLVPVIAQVMQFTDAEKKLVEESWASSTWFGQTLKFPGGSRPKRHTYNHPTSSRTPKHSRSDSIHRQLYPDLSSSQTSSSQISSVSAHSRQNSDNSRLSRGHSRLNSADSKSEIDTKNPHASGTGLIDLVSENMQNNWRASDSPVVQSRKNSVPGGSLSDSVASHSRDIRTRSITGTRQPAKSRTSYVSDASKLSRKNSIASS
eukprot:267073_1